SKLFLLVPPQLYRRLITMRDAGGAIMSTDGVVGAGIQGTPSDVLTDQAVLMDSTGIVAASDGLVVAQNTATTLVLGDNPAGARDATSLFQNNLTAVRAERRMGLEVARPSCLCLITGVSPTG